MSERYVRLQHGVVGGIVPPSVELRVGAFERGGACAVVVLKTPADGSGSVRWGAVVPVGELDALFASLGKLGVWDLPIEHPPGGEDIYGMDTSLWLCDGERVWHNGAPPGCVHTTSDVRPDEEQAARFSAAVDLINTFAFEHAEDEARPSLAAVELLESSEDPGAWELAEDLREWAELRISGYPVSPRPEHRAEAGGSPGLRWTLHGHAGSVDACAISADGALVASGGEDAAIRVWDACSGSLVWLLGDVERPEAAPRDPTSIARDAMARALGAGGTVRALGFSQDGRYLAQVASEILTLWNLEQSAAWDPGTREQLACTGWLDWGTGQDEGWVQACRVNEAGGTLRIWFALPDDSVVWVDVEREDGCLVEIGRPAPEVRHIAFRPDGGSMIAIAPPAAISVGSIPEELRGSTAGVIPLNAHDRSRGFDRRGLVFSVGNTHGIVGQGGAAYVIAATEFPPDRLTVSLDGALVACSVACDLPLGVTACMGAQGESVCVWDLERREPVRKLAVEDVTDCMLSADGTVLVTSSGSQFVRKAGDKGVVRVWDV